MEKEVYRIEIPIETIDEYSDGLKKAEKDVEGFEKTLKRAERNLEEWGKSSKIASNGIEDVGRSTQKAIGHVTKFQGAMEKQKSRLNKLSSSKWDITVRAVDRASKVISGISSFTQRVAGRSYSFTIRAIDMASKTVRFLHQSLTSIPAMVTVALSVVGAKSFLDATVGAAAQMELAQVQVTSLFGKNQKAANKFFDFLNKAGADSMFSQEDFFGSGRAFVPLTKNLKELKYAVGITERLAASNPLEGMEGASFAIREALSGDLISLAERFNLPKTMLASIKTAPTMQRKLEALDKVLGKMGYSQNYLNRVNDTGYVRWQKLIDTTKLKFTEMGKSGLQAAKPLIADLNKMVEGKGFKEFGNTMSQGITWGIKKIRTGFGEVNDYFSNPQFKKLSFEGKLNFIMDDVGGSVSKWWSSKGKPTLDQWWTSTGKPWAEKTGLSIGEAIFKGIVTGIKEGMSTIGGMWGDVGSSIKKNGIFSKETSGAIGGAGIASLGALALGSMALSPLLKGGGMLVNTGKWAYNKTLGRGKGGAPSAPVVTTVKETKPSAPAKKPVIVDQYGNPISSKPVPKQQTVPKAQPVPKAPPPSKGWTSYLNPKNWKLPKMPKLSKMPKLGGAGSLLKKVPIVGGLLGITALAGSTKDTLAGNIGSLGGGIAGAKLGAMGGAALGSVVPGVGTAIGGVAGGLLGGIGGAIGGEKVMNWLFGPKKAEASTTSSSTQTNSLPQGATPIPQGATPIDSSASAGAMVNESMMALAQQTQLATTNMSTLTSYIGQASGWVVGGFSALQTSGAAINSNMAILLSYLGQASGWVVGAFNGMQSAGAMLTNNMNILSSYVAQASGWVVGGFYSLQGTGNLIATNANILTSYLGMASGWVVAGFSPVQSAGARVSGNASILASYLGQASGWVVSLNGIQSGAAAVKSALSGLAGRINSVSVPSIPSVSAPNVPKHANGGLISQPHLGLVGEAGPEMIIPLSSGRRNRAMDLYQKTGQMLGVRPYANGGLVGGEPLVPAMDMPVSTPSGAVSGITISAPILLTVDGSGGFDAEAITSEILDLFGMEVVKQLNDALSNLAT
ncbi:hypothetical protein [Rummeliibacillus sp. POC4]|uniref:hypothetical protein n=1 Tax=Rummeliibacillus sp. POC4 TaxID=2305899 RepID=UPI000E674920|nr:hypothetical protein [Rummeliibacillus sp. POC4]RIJ63602.1 hypothetical protein D1606_14070 [Rummeliibacillus sp. POC4]